jgi:hypothetical protein
MFIASRLNRRPNALPEAAGVFGRLRHELSVGTN